MFNFDAFFYFFSPYACLFLIKFHIYTLFFVRVGKKLIDCVFAGLSMIIIFELSRTLTFVLIRLEIEFRVFSLLKYITDSLVIFFCANFGFCCSRMSILIVLFMYLCLQSYSGIPSISCFRQVVSVRRIDL